MSKETMQLGEGFAAKIVRVTRPVEVKTRHRVIGYGAILALLSATTATFIVALY